MDEIISLLESVMNVIGDLENAGDRLRLEKD